MKFATAFLTICFALALFAAICIVFTFPLMWVINWLIAPGALMAVFLIGWLFKGTTTVNKD